MKRKHRRLLVVLACLAGLGTATGLTLAALRNTIVFFLSPAQVAAKPPGPGQVFRLGGLVVTGSVRHLTQNGHPVNDFTITDGKGSVPVVFAGVLPDLFREGQGIVALGSLRPDGRFVATEVLAKHDANYMPKDVVEALKKNGEWRPSQGEPPPAATWDFGVRTQGANARGAPATQGG
ncbi:MAG: cytochrome c maturation protein CcmE [Rhodospirillales bacterium]|nr:cytochrome c maturation protein CcmE [Rhodospirillales bacterium]